MLKKNDFVHIYDAHKCPICGHAPEIEIVCDTDGMYGIVRCCGYEYKNHKCAKAIESWNEHVTWRANLLKNNTPVSLQINEIAKRAINGVYGLPGRKYEIKDVIFNNPATIILWTDGTKTVVKCQNDEIYDPEKGMAMAIAKKVMGNKGNYYDVFKKYIKQSLFFRNCKQYSVIFTIFNYIFIG